MSETLVKILQELDSLLTERDDLRQKVLELEAGTNNRRKLSPGEVDDIRKMHQFGVKQSDIAREYDINPATVSRIIQRVYHK